MVSRAGAGVNVGMSDTIFAASRKWCSAAASHVLRAMGMSEDEANCHVRLSWCHLTPEVDWEAVAERVRGLE